MIRRDLLGPAGGEQEVITEQSVRNRYLLGMLAPLNISETEEEPLDELADDSEDVSAPSFNGAPENIMMPPNEVGQRFRMLLCKLGTAFNVSEKKGSCAGRQGCHSSLRRPGTANSAMNSGSAITPQ
jgi:hypothetical protein